MTRIISATVERWPVAGTFTISRGAKTSVDVVVCTVGDGAHVGRGEGTAIYYEGETAEGCAAAINAYRSEEHTSELQSLMRISYAVFCLKKKNIIKLIQHTTTKR